MALEEVLGGAVGGAIVSAIIGPWIAQRSERRDLRAAVLRAVAEVEQTRWMPGGKWEEFREAIVTLRTAALVAGAKRDVVDRYLFLAQVARRASETDFEFSEGDPEFGGGISASPRRPRPGRRNASCRPSVAPVPTAPQRQGGAETQPRS